MPFQENLNRSPYYADYNPLTDYYSLLFKAGKPIQARELTNMQLMQQHQLETFMSRFMKEGDQIVPGERAYSTPAYVRVSSITQGATASEFIGYSLTGAVSGVVAVVQFAVDETTDDDTTFYVSYESQGSTSEYITFIEGETLLSNTPNNYTATVGVTGVSKPLEVDRLGVATPSPALGRGSLYKVAEGYYFTNGTSVRNDTQIITLEKYTDIPTYQVGFVVTEQFITSNDNPALLDNSQGSSNYAAPGADRLKINLVLTKTTEDSEIDNFIQLSEIIQGVQIADPTQQTKWQWLYDILAKRTYDESGNYIITEFPIDVTSYPNTEYTDGLFDADADGMYPSVPGSGATVDYTTPNGRVATIADLENIADPQEGYVYVVAADNRSYVYRDGVWNVIETDTLTFAEANSKYVVKVSPGEAYVQGFNVAINKPVYVFGNKPRVQSFRSDVVTPITTPFDVMVTNVYNIPDFTNSVSSINTEAYDKIVMYRNFNDGYVGEGFILDGQGNSVPINAGLAPPTTYHVSCDSNIGNIDTTGVGTIYKEGRGAVVTIPSDKVIARWDGSDENGTGTQINILGGAKVLFAIKINPTPAGVIYPRYFMPKSIVNTEISVSGAPNQGVAGWDSTYDMGIIKTDYFTELLMLDDKDATNFSTPWVVGDLVYIGNDVKSFATVEAGTTNDILIVSNIIGNIEPGRIVIQGNKRVRIARPNSPLSFQFAEFGNISDLSTVTEVTVSALGSTKNLKKSYTKDGVAKSDFSHRVSDNTLQLTKRGRSKLQNFPFPKNSPDGEFDAVSVAKLVDLTAVATAGSNTITGYVITLPGKTNNSMVKTKSFFSDLADSTNFSADLAIDGNLDVNTIPVASGSLFSGNANDNFITCNNFDGNSANELTFGDLIIFTDSVGSVRSHLVLFATEPVGYGSDRAKSLIYLTTPLVNNVISSVVSRVRMKSLGEPQNNLLFQLPQKTVATLQSNVTKTAITYFVLQEFIESVSSGATSVTLTLTESNERFIQGNNNVIVSETKIGDNLDSVALGRQLTVATAAVEEDGRKMVITFTEGTQLQNNATLKIIIPIQVTNAKAKQKILKEDQTLVLSEVADYSTPVISLGRADVIAVSTIMSNGKDIRENYDFNSGQNDNFYGISFLTLTENSPPATGALTINYDYYEHSGNGDFFSVDSYIPAANAEATNQNTKYEAIPVYAPIAGIPIDSDNSPQLYIELRDCIDFRPVVNTLTGDPSYIPSITPGGDSTSSTNFKNANNAGNGFAPRMPLIGSNFECNIAFYQPKIDSLFMEKDGSLTLVEGVPSSEPVAPPDLSTGIRLYDFKLPPYTFSIDSVNTEKYNYKSYTMQDIVGLERRITRVEELVTLSILEQSALNMSVKDAVTGLDRFKNGIVVDNFSDHSQGATGARQYKCSIDPVTTHMRAAFNSNQIELIESRQTDAARLNYGYRKEGPQIMVNYTSQRFLQNPFATRFINLQPYSVFTYEGEVELQPAIDTWKDVTRKPKLVIKDTNVYDAMVNMADEINDLGLNTVWGDWESTGKTKTTVNRRVVNGTQQERNQALRELEASVGTGRNAAQIARLQSRGTTPPIQITTKTKSTKLARQQTQTKVKVSTGSIKRTSYGDRITDVSLAETMRTRRVRVSAGRLKPNARYYIFFDDVDVTQWFCVDRKVEDADGEKYFRGNPGKKGSKNQGFGAPIISDERGNLAGSFIIPNGRPPVQGNQKFKGMDKIDYQTSGPTRSFNTGTRKFRITSSSTDAQDLTQVEGFAETTYVASGVLLDKQKTVVATTIPKIRTKTKVIATDKRWRTDSEKTKANYYDPVAQTFMIDENFPAGLFVSELDVFFQTKDNREGVEAYLVTTDGQVPTADIIPYSVVVKNTDSYLRTVIELGVGINSETLKRNTEVVGAKSGATGIVKGTRTFESESNNPDKNVKNNVYRIKLKNYTGEFIPGERIIPQVQPASTSKIFIAQNEVAVDYVDVTRMGSGYVSGSTTVTFSEPQLPGGVAATGIVKVGAVGSSGEGRVYEVEVTSQGSGYTKAPSATISGSGNNATTSVKIEDEQDAVEMGVATSEDATAATTFRFQTPIYLMSDTTYAFVVKAPTSLEYRMWTSKIGETRVGTNRRVTEQPSLGSIFLSQNGSLWTEDQTIDVKFVLRRSKFVVNQTALINLINEPQSTSAVSRSIQPIRTNSNALVGDSNRFGENPKIIRIRSPHHGFNTDDYVAIEGVSGNPGGIPDAEINTLHRVIDVSINNFTIQTVTGAVTTERAGGYQMKMSRNNMYETINVNTGAMVFGPTTITAETIATNGLSPSENIQANNGDSALSRIKYTKDIGVDIDLLETYYHSRSKTVLNSINEAAYRSSDRLNKENSLDVNIYLTTSDDAVSPVINLERTNATVVRNIVNYPRPTDPIYGAIPVTLNMSGDTSTLSSVIADSEVSFTNAQGVARTVYVDSRDDNLNRIYLKGEFTNELADTHTITTSDISALVVESIDVDSGEFYYPEVRDNGSGRAKFISRLYIFENQCDGINMKLTACSYKKDSIRCYYRTRDVGFDGDVSQIAWTPFNENQEIITTVVDANQANKLVEQKQVVPGLPDDINKIKVRDADNVNPDEIFDDGWQTLSWTAQDISAFDAIAIKIVMVVDNPALVPIIDDMQLICSE